MQTVTDVLADATKAHLAGDWPRAEYLYCKVIAHAEDHPVAYFLLGTLYAQAQAPGRAITLLKRAIEMDPGNGNAMQNLAAAYRQIEEYEKAVHWNEKSLAISRSAAALNNLAGCYINQGAPQKALEYADEALALEPGFPEAGNHRALALLEMGRFEEGWKQYDSRIGCVGKADGNTMTRSKFTRRPYTVPMWTGAKVGLLAIHGEQGLGDEIMFLSCMRQLRARYDIDRVVVECNPRLIALLENSLGVTCYGTHDELVAAEKPDAYIPMGSLPGFVWPVVPNAYLKATWSVPRAKRFRVGVSWYGGSPLTHDRLRNTLVAEWRTLVTPGPDMGFISLQYGDHADAAKVLGIPHDAEAIADLDCLASLILSCNLVVSVCNTTIHMAGALGVPCLVLVPSKPAWRYGLTGDKMAWYDSVTMLRQADGESWANVLARAKEWVADFRARPKLAAA